MVSMVYLMGIFVIGGRIPLTIRIQFIPKSSTTLSYFIIFQNTSARREDDAEELSGHTVYDVYICTHSAPTLDFRL